MPLVKVDGLEIELATTDQVLEFMEKRAARKNATTTSLNGHASVSVRGDGSLKVTWTATTVKQFVKGLPRAQKMAALALAKEVATIESRELADACQIKRKGVGSVLHVLTVRAQDMGLPPAYHKEHVRDGQNRVTKLTADPAFRASAKEAGLID